MSAAIQLTAGPPRCRRTERGSRGALAIGTGAIGILAMGGL
jgi:hypothetical protein